MNTNNKAAPTKDSSTAPPDSVTLTFTREELSVLVEATAHSSGPSGWQARLTPVAAKILEAWQRARVAEQKDR